MECIERKWQESKNLAKGCSFKWNMSSEEKQRFLDQSRMVSDGCDWHTHKSFCVPTCVTLRDTTLISFSLMKHLIRAWSHERDWKTQFQPQLWLSKGTTVQCEKHTLHFGKHKGLTYMGCLGISLSLNDGTYFECTLTDGWYVKWNNERRVFFLYKQEMGILWSYPGGIGGMIPSSSCSYRLSRERRSVTHHWSRENIECLPLWKPLAPFSRASFVTSKQPNERLSHIWLLSWMQCIWDQV